MNYLRHHTSIDETIKWLRNPIEQRKRNAHELFGRPHFEISREEWARAAVVHSFNRAIKTKNVAAMYHLSKEALWDADGRPVFFPMPGLLESLFRANIDIAERDFVPPRRNFAVAVPKGTVVNGISLPPFLASFHGHGDNVRFWKMIWKLIATEGQQEPDFDGPLFSDLHQRSYLDLLINVGTGDQRGTIDAGIIEKNVKTLLHAKGEERETEATRELIRDGWSQTEANIKLFYTVFKTLIHLVVYMAAFPQSVREGYPEQFSDDGTRDKEPMTVGGQHFGGTHASPHGHYRTWHFRSYPTKRDGTKHEGLVEVRETWVNRDSETPATVMAEAV
jgi:hypothetical protein